MTDRKGATGSEGATAADRWLGWAAIALAVVALGRWGMVSSGFEYQREPESRWYPDPPYEPPPPPPYLPAARALLGGLDSGDAIEHGWVVDHVEGPAEDGVVRVVVIRSEQRISVWIRPQGSDERPPPIHTERWDIYYDRPDPLLPTLGPGELAAVVNGVADRVRAHEME